MELYEKPEESERCVWCDAFLAAFSIFSFPCALFRRFSPLGLDPPTTKSLFPGRNSRDDPGPSSTVVKEEEREKERGAVKACPKAAISFFRWRGFLEQAASRWTPPGFGNVSIRDSTGR